MQSVDLRDKLSHVAQLMGSVGWADWALWGLVRD